MRFIDDIPVWGDPQENAVLQMKNCAGEAESCALMADHHLGYAVPIGGVVAYQGRVSPSGVGFDIACGNKAVRLDCDHGDIRKNIPSIMDEIWKSLSFGVGRVNRKPVDHDLFYDDPAWKIPVAERLETGRQETVGHHRQRQPLCRPLLRRAGADLGRSALRVPRFGPQAGLPFHQGRGRQERDARGSGAAGRGDRTRGRIRGVHGAGGPLCVRGPGLGLRNGRFHFGSGDPWKKSTITTISPGKKSMTAAGCG